MNNLQALANKMRSINEQIEEMAILFGEAQAEFPDDEQIQDLGITTYYTYKLAKEQGERALEAMNPPQNG